MRAAIEILQKQELSGLPIFTRLNPTEQTALVYTIDQSHMVWIGRFNGEVACIWGIVLPTFLSMTPYLWLHVHPDKLVDNEFLFIRYSQRVVENLLETYPSVIGVTNVNEERSVRWLKLLGATFGEVQKKVVLPFVIRGKNG